MTPRSASAGRRHVVPVLVVGERPRVVGREIQDHWSWQPDYQRRIREHRGLLKTQFEEI